MRTQFRGTGFVTGEHKVTNADMAKVCDTSDEWIKERSGIEQRYFVGDNIGTSDLGVEAAKKAMAEAGVTPADIDYVVFATMTPDYYFPGSGSLLQAKMGMGNIPALDIRQQCTGFIYGLQVSDALIRSGAAKKLLLVGAEIHSGFMPWTKQQWDVVLGKSTEDIPAKDREWATKFRDRTVLFGDAAGAVVLTAGEGDTGLLGFKLHADGSQAKSLYVPSGGFAFRPYFTPEHFAEGRHVPHMEGRDVFKMAVTKMPQVVEEILGEHNLKVSDISLLIPHQANLRISEGVQKKLGLPDEKVFNNIQRYGNTTAATIPIAYHEAKAAGRIKKGDLVCFVGLGAGFHWGAALMRE
ncbi:MAG: ketoacyl-ACP synthase III [Deltaproteobacteria bacterium]|nr:ketoacyl-ACP synthase III [Deltaproteobacteria bacterium]